MFHAGIVMKNSRTGAASSAFRLLLAAALAGVLIWLIVIAPRNATDRGPSNPAVGTRIDTLTFVPLVGGEPIDAGDLQGKVTLVNYWGPWCGYCVVEFPHLMELEQHFRSNPSFQFLSVSCSGMPGDDANMAASTAAFLADKKAEFPAYRDPGAVSRNHLDERASLGGFGYPTTVVLDRQRVIRGLWVGFIAGDEIAMRQVIEQELRKN